LLKYKAVVSGESDAKLNAFQLQICWFIIKVPYHDDHDNLQQLIDPPSKEPPADRSNDKKIKKNKNKQTDNPITYSTP
jgi:hypothetical protein